MLHTRLFLIVITQLFFHLFGFIYSGSFVISASKSEDVVRNQVRISVEETSTNSSKKDSDLKDSAILMSKDPSAILTRKCRTPDRQKGYCIEIKRCPHLLKLLNNSEAEVITFLRDSRCVEDGGDDTNPKVCCKIIQSSKNSTNDSGTLLNREIFTNSVNTITFTDVPHMSAARDCFSGNLEVGQCVNIKSCPALLEQLNTPGFGKLIQELMCDPDEKNRANPKVCCMRNVKIANGFQEKSDAESFPKECGQQKVHVADRIVGGMDTSYGEFPWMARLVHGNKSEGRRFFGCSAFLIHRKYVLTAAHCVSNRRSKLGPVISVFLGGNDAEAMTDCLDEECDKDLIIREVQTVIVHPKYSPHRAAQYNDIAIIRMSQQVQVSDLVRPICLNRDSSHIPSEYVISGWGKTETDNASSAKMKATIPVVNTTECNNRYTIQGVTIEETQICAGGKDGKDTCKGDSGGPLMYLGTNNTWYAAGITSFGVGCGVNGWPGVYTNISYFVPWLTEVISDEL